LFKNLCDKKRKKLRVMLRFWAQAIGKVDLLFDEMLSIVLVYEA
jgi:hypothetical protein